MGWILGPEPTIVNAPTMSAMNRRHKGRLDRTSLCCCKVKGWRHTRGLWGKSQLNRQTVLHAVSYQTSRRQCPAIRQVVSHRPKPSPFAPRGKKGSGPPSILPSHDSPLSLDSTVNQSFLSSASVHFIFLFSLFDYKPWWEPTWRTSQFVGVKECIQSICLQGSGYLAFFLLRQAGWNEGERNKNARYAEPCVRIAWMLFTQI